MGNRAVIALDEYSDDAIGIYLHWNGGRDSIEGFLQAAREQMSGRLGDPRYGRARLIQVIGTFMEGSLSLGMGKCSELDCDNGDQGVYIVDSETLTITGRRYRKNQEQKAHDSAEIAQLIRRRIALADSIKG
jgi:hypothetical protein